MPIKRSAKKALRSSEKKRVFNVRRKNAMQSAVKNVRKLIAAGKKDEAIAALAGVQKAIDKAAKRGVIKSNTADRKKSRLAAAIKKVA